jgi:hypothetical protein
MGMEYEHGDPWKSEFVFRFVSSNQYTLQPISLRKAENVIWNLKHCLVDKRIESSLSGLVRLQSWFRETSCFIHEVGAVRTDLDLVSRYI